MVRARSGFCDAEGFALDVDTSGLVTTLVVEVLEVDAKWVNSERWPRTPTGCKSVPPQVCSRHVRRRLSRESIHTSFSNLTASWLLPGCAQFLYGFVLRR